MPIIDIFSRWAHKHFFLCFPRFLAQMVFFRVVLLANNIGILFHMDKPLMLWHHWSWFIVTAYYFPLLFLVPDMCLHSLMTSLDVHGCTFWSTSLMSLIHFKSLRLLWRSSLVFQSFVSTLTMGGNMWINLSEIFALSKVYSISSLFPIHLNRMGLLRERTGHYKRWPIVWYNLEIWVLSFGMRL